MLTQQKSYCWGPNPKHLTLTTENIGQLQTGIALEQLAQTFKDTIITVQALGISLLWIDNLCILQSGPGATLDWQKHVTEMSVIYSNCLLNVAADHGESAVAGCFVVRDPVSIRPLIFTPSAPQEITAADQTSQSASKVRSICCVDQTLGHMLFDNTHLLTRGWVHQERLFSPRILHFGAEQLSWQCHELRACETYPMGLPGSMYAGLPFSLQDDSWSKIVQGYSRASLTKSADKLAALAGIAERMCELQKTSYVAGLLHNSLPNSLLWWSDGSRQSRAAPPYRAPSWSWASRDGKLEMPVEAEALCGIETISLQYVNPSNPYGQIISGAMVISGCIVQAVLEPLEDKNLIEGGGYTLPARPESCTLLTTEGENIFGDLQIGWSPFSFDDLDIDRDREGMVFILIAGELAKNYLYLHGLILAPAQQLSYLPSWERIGAFTFLFGEDLQNPTTDPKTTTKLRAEIFNRAKSCPKSRFRIV